MTDELEILPDWLAIDQKIVAGESITSLEKFIHENEPQGDSGREFRKLLTDAVWEMEFRLFRLMERVLSEGREGMFDRDMTEWFDDFWKRMPDEMRKECEYHRRFDKVIKAAKPHTG